MNSHYLNEALSVAAIHLLALAAPGPDFAVIVHTSIAAGKRNALWVALGIAMGLSVHVSYTLLGLGLLLLHSKHAFLVFKAVSVGYLTYLGLRALASKPNKVDSASDNQTVVATQPWRGFRTGFLVNLLNPKASLFCVALFSSILDAQTPKPIQIGYGVWIICLTVIWFSAVAHFFTRTKVRQMFLKISHWLDKLLGIFLIGLGAKISLL